MKVSELRAFLKDRSIKGFSTLKKGELKVKVQKIQEQEEIARYEHELRETAVCSACLHEQRVQRKIDDKTYNQRLLENITRILFCDYCKHAKFAADGDQTVCEGCGALQAPDEEVGY